MSNQMLDATLTLQDIEAIMAAIKTIREQLPFLVGLSPQERRQITKMGRKAQTFTVRSLDMAVQHSELMPRNLDVEEARRDIALFEALNPLVQAISQLQELLQDTQMVAGSEAYAAARLAYNAAKMSGKNVGMDDVIDDLAKQFRRVRKTQPVAE